MNGYLLLAVFGEDLVPIGLYPTRQEVDEAALLLTREIALELNRKVFMDDEDLGIFFGSEAVRFQDGKPISVVPYPRNWADDQQETVRHNRVNARETLERPRQENR